MNKLISSGETSDIHSDPLRASALFSQTQGAMVLTVAGLGWMMIGLSALGEIPLTWFLAVLAAAALLLLGALAVRRSFPNLLVAAWTPQISRVFAQAFLGEVVGILVIVFSTLLLHRTLWIPPLVALAVGLHFFPLARAFRRPVYVLTGATLCLICIITIIFVPQLLGPHHTHDWLLVTGLSSGAALWSTSLAMLFQSWFGLRRFSRSQQSAKDSL